MDDETKMAGVATPVVENGFETQNWSKHPRNQQNLTMFQWLRRQVQSQRPVPLRPVQLEAMRVPAVRRPDGAFCRGEAARRAVAVARIRGSFQSTAMN